MRKLMLLGLSVWWALAVFGTPPPVQARDSASDVILECRQEPECELLKAPASLINVSNAVPGTKSDWSMMVRNRTSQWCTLSLSFEAQSEQHNLSQALLLRIFDADGRARRLQATSFEVMLSRLISEPVIFGYLGPQASDQWIGQLEFAPAADNQYQAGSLIFDTLFHVTCDKTPPPRGTASESGLIKLEPVQPTPTSSIITCDLPKPVAPELQLRPSSKQSDSVGLTWQPLPDGQLEIQFGPTDSASVFTHWTSSTQQPYRVGLLESGITYLFAARLHTGCAVSDWSRPISTDGQPVAIQWPVPTPVGASQGTVLGAQLENLITLTPTVPNLELDRNNNSCSQPERFLEWPRFIWCQLWQLWQSLISY